MKQPELATAADMHKDRLRAILGGYAKTIAIEELYAIADATGVPRTFMADGFTEAGDLAARVAKIEGQIKALAGGALVQVAPRTAEERTQEGSPPGTRSSPNGRD